MRTPAVDPELAPALAAYATDLTLIGTALRPMAGCRPAWQRHGVHLRCHVPHHLVSPTLPHRRLATATPAQPTAGARPQLWPRRRADRRRHARRLLRPRSPVAIRELRSSMQANPLSPSPADEQSIRKYRVVQWSTGTIGACALRAVIEHPHMSLAGVYVHGRDKVGRDAGELCGTASIGVAATASIDDIVELGPDCVLYMPPSLNPGELCPLLTAGINVVTTCGAFHHLASMDPDVRAQVQTACEIGGTSVHSTGSSPGFITEAVPLVLTSIQRQLTALTIDEYADLSQRNSPELLFDLMGYGRPAGPFEQFEPTTCARVSARRCGWWPMRSGCLSTRWKQAASWRWPATTRRLRRARSTREMLQRNASQSAASRAAGHSSGSGPRGTAPPTLIPHGKSVRQVGTCQSTATHRLRSLSGCPSRWTAWPRCHPPTPPTERSTRCPTSAPPPRAFTRPWTFPRSSRHSAEKQVLLSGEYKLPKTSLLLTPAPGRCQSYETNSSHLSYATLIHREARRDDQC